MDVLVLVILELLDLGEAVRLGYQRRERVVLEAGILHVLVPHLQDVLESLHRDGDDLGVVDLQQVAEGTDATLRDEVFNLLAVPPGCRVGYGPSGLLFYVELGVGEEVDEEGEDAVLDDGLDLLGVPRGYVAHRPARLLPDVLLGGGEELLQAR